MNKNLRAVLITLLFTASISLVINGVLSILDYQESNENPWPYEDNHYYGEAYFDKDCKGDHITICFQDKTTEDGSYEYYVYHDGQLWFHWQDTYSLDKLTVFTNQKGQYINLYCKGKGSA